MNSNVLSQNPLRRLLAVFFLLIVFIGAAGYAFFDYLKAAEKTNSTEHLASTGTLRADHIAAFLNERREDARVLAGVLSAGLGQDWWQARDRALPAALQQPLKTALASYGYSSALILDATADVRFNAGRSAGLSDAGKRDALRVLNHAAPVFSDLYPADPAALGNLMLVTFAPIMSRDGGKAVGVLVMRGNWDQLFALTQPWPAQSRTVEYLLVRKDGDNALFLNQLRHQQPAAPRLRVSLLSADERSAEWPAIRAAQGHYGALEAVDYRGKTVLAYSLPVPDTDWSMVAKVDVEEALADVQRLEKITFIAALAFILFAFAMLWGWLRARSRAELVLRTSEERLNEAQRVAQVGSWELDLVANKLTWSDEIFRIFEIDKTKFGATYEAFLNAIHPEDLKAVNAAYTGSLVTRKPYDITHRLRMADGRIKYVHERCESEFDAGGKPLQSMGTVQDITERKLADEALAESHRLLQAIINTSPVRIFWKDKELRYLGCNPAFAKDAGEARPDDLIGKNDYQLSWKAQAELYRADDRLIIDSGIPKLSYEEPQTTPDGHYIWLRTSKVPLRNEEHETIGVLGIYEDITESKHAEEEILKLNTELEQRVRERTSELQSANKELETFTYSVAHDLKAPLRGIDGYSRLLLANHADKLDAEGRGFLQNVRRATQKMDQLINDLLAYSRLERRDMQMEQLNLQALIEALLAERVGDISSRGVAATVAVPCTSVTADREGLTMVLRNLLENALKFTCNVPQPMIELSGHDTGTTCILSVRDNGVGFDMKFHDRIFDIFQRLHRSEDYPGTGVGLAIVRKAMQRMGGRTWAESKPGKGATFYLEIPK